MYKKIERGFMTLAQWFRKLKILLAVALFAGMPLFRGGTRLEA